MKSTRIDHQRKKARQGWPGKMGFNHAHFSSVSLDRNNNPLSPADYELMEAWRAVANAKLAEYRRQTWRLALLTKQSVVSKPAAIDRLWEIAGAHALVRSLGDDRIQAILSEAFGLEVSGHLR
jgi:hypothetical protein